MSMNQTLPAVESAKANGKNFVPVTVPLSFELYAELRALADEERRSMANFVRNLIEDSRPSKAA